ncbi:hypothetical protein ABPG74_019178 [Tetrahymena malaccensis]
MSVKKGQNQITNQIMLSKSQIKQFSEEIKYREDDLSKILYKLSKASYQFKKIAHNNSSDSISQQYLLGQGGQAFVVLGEHIQTKQEIAIKFSKSDNTAYEEMIKELDQIKRIMNYDYIVEIKDSFFLKKEMICIQIIELCSKSLSDDIKENRKQNISYPLEQVIFIVQSAINSLCEIHTNDIIHFDIKTSNILITKDGQYKLADFGHSKTIKMDQTHMKSYGFGTIYYNSPEQCKENYNQSSIVSPDFKIRNYTDIYSMGVSLLEVIGVVIDFNTFNFLQSNQLDKIDNLIKQEYKNIYSFIKHFMLQYEYKQRYSAIRLRSIFFQQFENYINKEVEIKRLERAIKKYESVKSEHKNKKYLAYLYYFLSDLVSNTQGEEYIKKSLSILQELNLQGKVEESIFLYQHSKIFQRLCKFQDSEEFLIKSHQILIGLYDDSHIEVGSSYLKLSELYEKNGQFKLSLETSQHALKIFEANFQNNIHPHLSDALNCLGASYEALGDSKKGLDYFLKALDMRVLLYEGNHPDIASSYSRIGISYGNQGDSEKDFEYQQKALTMREQLFKGNHLDVADSLNNLGVAYGVKGDVNKEQQYYRRALAMREALYQGNHPDIANSLNNLGLSEALQMRNNLYRGDHYQIAQSLNNLGITYGRLGNHKKELSNKLKALNMRLKLYSGNHPDISQSFFNLGLAYGKSGDTNNELDYKSKALQMQQELYKGNHPKTVLYLKNIAKCYFNLGQQEQGNEYLEKSKKMKEELDIITSQA